MPLLSGAEAILKSLELHGVETIFGLPGGQLDHFFDHDSVHPVAHVAAQHC